MVLTPRAYAEDGPSVRQRVPPFRSGPEQVEREECEDDDLTKDPKSEVESKKSMEASSGGEDGGGEEEEGTGSGEGKKKKARSGFRDRKVINRQ